MPIGDILQALRDRISFFGIYDQVDKINHSKITIKKLKYQIKLERELREKGIEKEIEKREKIEKDLHGQIEIETKKREKLEENL